MKLLFAATAAGLLALSAPAMAAPVAKHAPGIAHSQVEKTDMRRRDYGDLRWGHRSERHERRGMYGPNNKYRGWHRYSHRPRDWGRRGCVAVGPIWFCP